VGRVVCPSMFFKNDALLDKPAVAPRSERQEPRAELAAHE